MHSLSLVLMSLFSRMHGSEGNNLNLGNFFQRERKIFSSKWWSALLCPFKSEKNPDDRNKKVNIFITSSLMTRIVDCRFTSSFVVVFVVVKKSWIFISC